MQKGTPLSDLPNNSSNDDAVQNMLNNIGQDDRQPAPQQQPVPQQQQYQPTLPQQPLQQPIQRVVKRRTQNLPLTDRVLAEAKLPLVVALLFFILNMSFVDKKIAMSFARLVNDDTGDLNYVGVGLKAVVFGLIVYVVKRFV